MLEKLEEKSGEYKKFIENQEKKSNNFINEHIFYIFSSDEESFNDELASKNLTIDDIIDAGAGAYYKKDDKESIDKFFDELYDTKKNYLNDKDNFYGALYYELWNHEYYFNADNDAIGVALCIDPKDIMTKYPDANDVVDIYLREFKKLNL